jgi:Transcriptional regulators
MNKNANSNQIQEFSDLWHIMIQKAHYDKIEEKFPRIQELSTIEIGIINIVSKKPDVILKEICSYLDIPKSTLTNAINRLENRNYINRVISKRDRRSFGLLLTEEGKIAQKEHLDFENIVYGRIINSLDTDEERKELFRLMKKIVENI